MAETLSVQIALDGGKEIVSQLEDIGTAGTKAFSDISAAASKVGGFDNLNPGDVTKKLEDMGVTGEASINKIIDAVKKASVLETIVNAVKAVENAFVSLGATVTKVVTILAKHEAASLGLGRAGVAAATAIVTAFGPLGVIIAVIAVAVAALGVVFVGAAKSIQALDAEAIKLNSTFEATSKVFLGLRAAGVSSITVISAAMAELQASINTLTLAKVEKEFTDAQKNIAAGWPPTVAQIDFLRQHVNDLGPAGAAARKALADLGQPIQDSVTPALEGMIRSAGGAAKAIPLLSSELTQMGTAGDKARLVSGLIDEIKIEAGGAVNATLPLLQLLQKLPEGTARNTAATQAFTGAMGTEIAQLINAGVPISDIIQKMPAMAQSQAEAATKIVASTNQITAGISAALQNIPIEKLTSAFKGIAGAAELGFGGATTSVNTTGTAVDALNKKLDTAITKMGQLNSAAPGGAGGSPAGHAAGGMIGGRGTGTSDSNLAWVSRGEYITPARAVQQPGVLAFLEALRRTGGDLSSVMRGMGRFALGGLVTAPAFAGGGINSMSHVTIAFPGLAPIGGLRASAAVVDELRHAAAMAQVRSGGRKPSRYS